MITNELKLEWLRIQTRNAAFLQFSISTLAFICFATLNHPIRDWRYYISFIAGTACGITVDSIIVRRTLGLKNPLVLLPLNRRKLKITETEAVKYLIPFWEHFPRIFYLVANIPYLIILTVIIFRAQNGDFTFKYAAWAFFFGFVSNVGLSDGAFFTFVVCTWKKVYK